MTISATPRHLLVIDAAILTGAGGIRRFLDLLLKVRNETVVVILGAGLPPGVVLPMPNYAIAPDGSRIERLPSHEPVSEWCAEGGARAAAEHLASSLMIAPSEIYALLSERYRGAWGVEAGEAAEAADGRTVVVGEKESRLDQALRKLHLFPDALRGQGDAVDLAFEKALEALRRNVTPMGFTAASVADNPLMTHDENYAAVWARDGVITGLWTLGLEDEELTSCFARTLEVLGRNLSPSGQVPSYVLVNNEMPQYSGIGGIASIDSGIWWVIGIARYSLIARNRAFAEAWVDTAERTMTWLAAHDSNFDGLLEVPESSDWMDLFPRSYNVLYDEVLWYQACADHSVLLQALGRDGTHWSLAAQKAKERILDLFWTTGQQLMDLAGSNTGRFSLGEARYLLAYVTPFGFSWRCDVLANLLAALNGLLTPLRQERLFNFLWGVGANEPYPVSCLYPSIQSGADDWKEYFVVNFLNLPYHYHNGGIWPFVGGLWVIFLKLIGRTELAHHELASLADACRTGLHEEWEFNEWLHGITGRPMGKRLQAWSAASFVQAYLFTREGRSLIAFDPLSPDLWR